MNDRRVVITGIGTVSPLGNDLATTWENLKAGKSGIGRITQMDTSDYTVHIAGEVKDFDPKPYFKNPKDARRADRYAQLGVAASAMAIADAGLDDEGIDKDRVGVMVGSGIGGLGTLEKEHRNLMQKSPGRVSPFVIPMMIANIASGMVSMDYGFGGPNMSIVTACATSNHNIGEAWRMIKFGDADAFVAGGAEATILPMGLAGFSNMKALSTRNDDPEAASRPFDTGRDGFVMGEGAGVLVIEEYEHAKKRGAKIYAELVGYGVSGDAYHITSPHPEGVGASRCMDMALKHAKMNPEDVDYVNAHGTSTPLGDICETKAIKRSFGDHAKDKLLVSSTKSMTGHLLGAAGGIEIAACIMSLQEGVIAPTINIEDQDPECDLDYCANVAREAKVKSALSNSFGFGGHNSSLLIKTLD
ncbi:beta-ketoacyl-ACP synthase II [Persicirhabdus sediminis]|uniref:3-oxoacyl-[acyl-carrier-protein] synthase 2 n=1 Tax=Persicirhabdus sediminis TaxID=454144 RepID=A0A8J7MF46_9BACT|nr:beta-ketoacyl-ACP synthase II [Persicirhabdus sediminis]MBK1792834.1 beta-ketoacyl-ACP synthase II [Persicirhabdus sediminis]